MILTPPTPLEEAAAVPPSFRGSGAGVVVILVGDADGKSRGDMKPFAVVRRDGE